MSAEKYNYSNPFSFKLIYVFRINDEEHRDFLKVGDATIRYDGNIEDLKPSCNALTAAANRRISSYTTTAGIKYELLYTELAYTERDGKKFAFRDHNVHAVLTNSGIKKAGFKNAREWFKTDLQTVKNAIQAVKGGKKSLTGEEISTDNSPIIFRPSQLEAIEKTVARFKKKSNKRMLWNAKMRFGKTLAAFEVIKRLNFAKTLILTHRPVVSEGWFEDFQKIFYDTKWRYGSKNGASIKSIQKTGDNLIYFASIQDMRGSVGVGGKFDKNDEILKEKWDMVIIDEAHEGTKTDLGQKVLEAVVTSDTKELKLSGTPFNIITEYSEEETYTWDYTMEQMAKLLWDKEHCGDSNPYEDLPSMQIYTFDLYEQFKNFQDGEKAFNFREFFRVWTGDPFRDGRPVPADSAIGRFVHEKDVINFLNLITKSDENSNYPFATEKFREYFRHTLWMLPGVKEAKALELLLKKHPVFGYFKVANVAGDEEYESSEEYNNSYEEKKGQKTALDKVNEAIGKNPEETYSITLSCGKLTTGVSVKPWVAVMMLAGSYSTSAMGYLQTIFRVQTPAIIDGKIKETCYVFDFAPDRTLKMMADAVNLSARAGRSTDSQRKAMSQLLNFCPIISVSGTNMKAYDVGQMLTQLKKAYIERVSRNGFDDTNLYNFNLPDLTEKDEENLQHLYEVVSKTGQAKAPSEVVIANEGMSNEKHDTSNNPPKSKKELSEEKKARKKKMELRRRIISNLRAISIRIPLLVYGADIPFEKDITIDNLTDIVDDESWAEFMPRDFSKKDFNELKKFYDPEVFVGAGKAIRQRVKNAESLNVTERVMEVAEIFTTFRNTDKETVLTPWRVVNMHMGDCLGGYNFFDENYKETIETPQPVDRGKITQETLWDVKVKVLEINSKTGLYPLYVAYTIFRARKQAKPEKSEEELWKQTLKENVFVLCKTPMAASITRRTLAGFKNIQVNARYRQNLLDDAKDVCRKEDLIKEISDGKDFWKANEEKEMKFDAVVGNPPYQISDEGENKASASPIYQHFVELAKNILPDYISMIMPARWYSGGKGLDEFRDVMLKDLHIEMIVDFFDSTVCFPSADISGGICYFLWNKKHSGECEITSIRGEVKNTMKRTLLEEGAQSFIRFNEAVSILRKVQRFKEPSFAENVSARRPFGFTTDVRVFKTASENTYKIYAYPQNGFIKNEDVSKNKDKLKKWKVLSAKAYGERGNFPYKILATPFIAEPNSCCSETYIMLDSFDKKELAENLISYIKTKFIRFLILLKKNTQDATSKVYQFVPIQDFSKPWTDEELYAKYGLSEDEIGFIEKMIKPME